MWSAELGAIVLVSPSWNALDMGLLVAGIVVGLVLHNKTRHSQLFAAACTAACLWSIAEDFAIPLDVVLLAALPVCVMNWRVDRLGDALLIVGFVINYALAEPVERRQHTWTPAVLAALCVMSGDDPWFRAGFVVARHVFPRKVHVMYGAILTSQKITKYSQYGLQTGYSLLCVGFVVIAQWSGPWFSLLLSILGVITMYRTI